jgi:CheY-like chemotaxis protein
MGAVLLSTDLMVASRVQGAAVSSGTSLATVSNVTQAVGQCRAAAAAVLFVDLALPALDVSALVNDLKNSGARPPRIIAFGPHVHEEKLAAAQQAGCDVVVSRGQFFAQVDSLLNV